MSSESIFDYLITTHAGFEMRRRGISEETVCAVLNSPEQRLTVRTGRVVFQSRVFRGEGAKVVLVRVFVDVDRTPAEVVTVYLTSKVSKYWNRRHED